MTRNGVLIWGLLILVVIVSGAIIVEQQNARTETRGIIVNHHLLAAQLIEEEFAGVRNLNPSVVVLISPNHFGRGLGNIQTTGRVWHEANQDLMPAIIDPQVKPLVHMQEQTFDYEHGIFNIIPYIAKTFEHARVLPLAIKETARDEQIIALADALDKTLPADTLFVGSFDFSHELPANAAEFHDRMSSAAIHAQDYRAVSQLDIDSRAGLRLLLELMRRRGAIQFEQTHNTNASIIVKQPWNTDNASYITGRFVTGRIPRAQPLITILILPRGSAAQFAAMPRLLFGQHMVVYAGDPVTAEQRARVAELGKTILSSVWFTEQTEARAVTITEDSVGYEQIYLHWDGKKFSWPNKDEFDMLHTNRQPISPFIK